MYIKQSWFSKTKKYRCIAGNTLKERFQVENSNYSWSV